MGEELNNLVPLPPHLLLWTILCLFKLAKSRRRLGNILWNDQISSLSPWGRVDLEAKHDETAQNFEDTWNDLLRFDAGAWTFCPGLFRNKGDKRSFRNVFCLFVQA